MRSFSRKQIPVFFFVLALSLLACNAITPGHDPYLAPVSATAPASLPTDTIVPVLSRQVSVASIPFSEDDPGNGYPKYTITSQIPQLTGSDDPRVLAFNQRLNDLVANEVNTWRQDFQQLPLTPLSNGSSLNVTYTLLGQKGDLWSFKFDFSFYADTAAHPGLNTITLNYDLQRGQELSLENLFLPGSDYLVTIANFCANDLQKRDTGFDPVFSQGAAPTAENYRNWNITPDGLMITFSEYQVAPYAAGPQTVLIPYAELASLIDPQGPLSAFLP